MAHCAFTSLLIQIENMYKDLILIIIRFYYMGIMGIVKVAVCMFPAGTIANVVRTAR